MVSFSQNIPPWWDRAVDDAGRPIRADVRSAALEIWGKAQGLAQRVLGDNSEAAELMEFAVGHVSRYLDRIDAPVHSGPIAGLLMLSFHRAVRRRAAKWARLKMMGNTSEWTGRLLARDWVEEINRRLDIEKLTSHLSPDSLTMLAMRGAGYGWNHIANLFGITSSNAQMKLSRDLQKTCTKMFTRRSSQGGTKRKE